MVGAGVGGAGAGARGGGHLGISGTLGGVSILGPEPLCREKLWGQKQELYQWMYVRWVGPRGRGYLVGVPGQPVPVVHHAAPPPASAPPTAARHRRRRSLGFNRLENIFELDKPCSDDCGCHLVDAGLAVEAGGVRVGAVQAPRHASSPLLLQQLRHDRLHSLRGLQWKISTIRVKIFFIDT